MKSKKAHYTPSLAEMESAEDQIQEQQKRIEYYITEYSIELLATKMRSEDLYIPGYQREFTWSEPGKSRFIESIIIGLPIPFLMFWENPETGKLEIVDGSQRLRTIEAFLSDNLVLEELDILTRMEGFKFSDLPMSRQRKILNRSIRGIVLNENADESARLDLFDRINTGSKIANKAEIRRGVLMGSFMSFVMRVANSEPFVSIAPVTSKQLKEREREELVTRFFAYSDGLENYADNVSDFMFNYIKKMNQIFKDNPEQEEAYGLRFLRTMNFISQVFPFGFRKTSTGKVSPRARFESIAIGTFEALRLRPDIAPGSVDVSKWIDSDEFKQVTGADGANAKSRLQARIEFTKNKVLGL